MQQGLKSYTKQFRHGLGGVGNLSINLCGGNKNMHMILPLISTIGQNPINLGLIYNEVERDEEGQFGKGFRLNVYKKLVITNDNPIEGKVQNFDGTEDNYGSTINKETGNILTNSTFNQEEGYLLTNNKGGEIFLMPTNNYPKFVKDSKGKYLYFQENNGKISKISNEYLDEIVFEESGNEIHVKYKRNNEVLLKTELMLTNSRITKIKYYEGSNNLIKEVEVEYEETYLQVKDETTGVVTKIVKSQNNAYTIFEGYMSGEIENYKENPDYNILYSTLNVNGANKTIVTNENGENTTYCFNSYGLLNMEIQSNGSVKKYDFDLNTKELVGTDITYVKESNNLAEDLEFSIRNTSSGNMGFINNSGEDATPNITSEIWNKLTYYNVPGSKTVTIPVNGEAYDTITFSFFMAAYSQPTTGTVFFTLSAGGVTKSMSFKNKENIQLEMHTMNIVTKEKYSNITITMQIKSGGICRVGSYTLTNKNEYGVFTYVDKSIEKIQKSEEEITFEYEDTNLKSISENQIPIVNIEYNEDDELNRIEYKNGTAKEYEYHPQYKDQITKERVVSSDEVMSIEKEYVYSEDGRFLETSKDEFGNETNYLYDTLGRVKKVIDALNNIVEGEYQNGLLSVLKLNTNEAQNNYYYDERKRLSRIETTGSKIYEFIYNDKNYLTEVKMDGVLIQKYSYDLKGNIIKQQNGYSGDYYEFSYDAKGRVENIYLNNQLKYRYEYDLKDRLNKIYDSNNQVLKTIVYDTKDRVTSIVDSSTNQTNSKDYGYSKEDEIIKKKYTIDNKTIHTSIDYLKRSKDLELSNIGNLKTIGFSGTNLESIDRIETSSFDIYPLHYDDKSINGNGAYMYKLYNTNTLPFTYDDIAKRYCFDCAKADLVYQLENSSERTIMFRFRKSIQDYGECLFELEDTTGQTILLKYDMIHNLALYFNGELKRTFSVTTNEWNTFGLAYRRVNSNTSQFIVYLNQAQWIVNLEHPEYTEMRAYIGRNSSLGDVCYSHIEMLAFADSYKYYDEMILMDYEMDIVSVKTSVDEFDRIAKKEVFKTGGSIIENDYTYITTNEKTSYRIATETIKNKDEVITTRIYQYDNLGRIVGIVDPVFGNKTYSYNSRGFLSSDNGTNITYLPNGNINYYGTDRFYYDSTIKDKLIQKGNYQIEYETGNVLYPKKLGLTEIKYKGNQLIEVELPDTYISYEYNEQGLRTKKTINNTTYFEQHTYHYDGNKLVTEIYISDATQGCRLDYIYDENDMLIGFVLDNESKYFYIRDVLQNILGIVDELGTVVVKYNYDAFGKITSIVDDSLSNIGTINPFRFKGYYYDVETQLFYCNSRYYSPELCRWISPDSIEYLDPQSINGLNLYCYCYNNPISYYDPSGHSALLIGLLIFTGAMTLGGAIYGGVSAGMAGGDVDDVFAGIGKGALNGLILGGGITLAIGGFAIGGTTILGSIMATYGLSISANMLEVAITQGKKSAYDGDDFWAGANDINNAMFANSGNILIGKPTLMSIPFYGTRMTSKIPTIFNVLVSYDLDKFFGSTTFLASAKATLLSKASPFGLAIGYGLTAWQYYNLIRAIVTTPDFENSRWILY